MTFHALDQAASLQVLPNCKTFIYDLFTVKSPVKSHSVHNHWDVWIISPAVIFVLKVLKLCEGICNCAHYRMVTDWQNKYKR